MAGGDIQTDAGGAVLVCRWQLDMSVVISISKYNVDCRWCGDKPLHAHRDGALCAKLEDRRTTPSEADRGASTVLSAEPSQQG